MLKKFKIVKRVKTAIMLKTVKISKSKIVKIAKKKQKLKIAEIVKRFKQIELDRQNSLSVLLLVAISQDGSAFKICVQAQPNFDRQILPPNLELNLIDASETVLASIQADARDNYIQLPYFRGVLQEEFGLSLSLDSITYQEKFVI